MCVPRACAAYCPKADLLPQGYDIDLIKNYLHVVSAEVHANGSCTAKYKLTVPEKYCNRLGNLHGGAASTIFDIATTATLAPIARPGHWQYAGVTRSLNVHYMRPAPCGLEIEIICTVVNAGRRLATISGEIWAGGKILMTCEHLKVQIDPPLVEALASKL